MTRLSNRLCLLMLFLALGSWLSYEPTNAATLNNGDTLWYGDTLSSDNGLYTLSHLHNGLLYRLRWSRIGWCGYGNWTTDKDGDCGIPGHANQWSIGDTGNHLVMQGDGNLVLYDGSSSPIWETNTDGYGSSAFLNAQNDGNLVMYYNTNIPIWSLY